MHVPLPLLVPVGWNVLPYLWSRLGQVMTTSGRRLPHPLVSDPEAYGCDLTDFSPSVFGTPILLKCKADEIADDAGPLPTWPSSLPPVAKCPHHNRELVDQMCGLLRRRHGGWT